MSRSKSKRARSRSARSSARATAHATRTPALHAVPPTAASAASTHAADKPTPPPPKLTDDPNGRSAAVRSGADYARRPVEWLWHKRIPIGKVTLLCGDPGLGKSLVALDVASRVTNSTPFPATKAEGGGGKAEGKPPNSDLPPSTFPPPPLPAPPAPGSVLVLTNEDDIADTVRPRFEALGGDLRRIFFDESITNLRDDFARLVETLDSIPDCRLLIVDPVNAFVGPSDSHFHTVVRRVLKPLADLAKQRGIAILAVTHLRKNNGATIQRAAGTMGFVGFARTVWTISRDGRDPNRRVVVPAKNNLGPTDDALAYRIAVHQELDVPMVAWEPQPLGPDAIEEAVAAVHKPRGPEAEERQAAAEWLTTALRQEPRMAGGLIREGKELGFSPRTLRRGLKAIGGTTTHFGECLGWQWSLPKPQAAPPNSPSEAPTHAAAKSTPPNTSESTRPPESARASAPEHRQSSAPHPAPKDTQAKPGPLETTWPLPGNTHIPTPDSRHLKPAPPPPGASSTIDDDTLESSMQFLDAHRARWQKPGPDPAPTATPSSTS